MAKILKLVAITGVLMLVAANVIAAISGGFTLPTFILAGIGLLAFLSIFSTGESGNLANYVRLGLNVMFFLGALVFLYLIISNHHVRWDLTKNKTFSLSAQTIRYMRGIKDTITITGFSTTPREMRRFFDQYTPYTDRLEVSVRNPFRDFREAQRLRKEFDTELYPGDVFIQCGKRKKKIRNLDESTFVNALVDVQRKKDTVVYFLTGHGEGSLEEPTEEQLKKNVSTYYTLKRICEQRGIRVKTLELMRTGTLPADASAIICTGPRLDLYPLERDALESYLDGGGRFILMLDPPTSLEQTFPNFKKLLANFGVVLKDDIIMDPNKASMERFGLPIVPLVATYMKHPITENIPYGSVALFVPLARTVTAAETLPATFIVKPLLKSSKYSWSQSVKALMEKKITPPERSEIGPQTLAVTATKTPPGADEDKQTRIVVFGDSDIFTDVNVAYQIPVYLFVNSFSWLTQKADIVAIPPKVVEDTPMSLTLAQREFLTVLLVVTLPSLIFFGGLGHTLIRRRVK